MSKKLTDLDFCKAAKRLRCDVPAMQAVDDTESKGNGFYADGFPTILFERHKFYKYTKGKFAGSHPEICNSHPGGYGKAGANQRRKFNLAFELDPKAAMLSCSWGRYQIMGFNYAVCGFKSVNEFVDAMKVSEGEQLLAFCEFVEENKLTDELRNHEWAEFARGYNGATYKKNKYDEKLATAYKKFSANPINCTKALEEAKNKPLSITNSAADSLPNNTEQSNNPQTPANEAPPPNALTGEVNKTGDFPAFLPQIDTAKMWAKNGISALFTGTLGSALAGLPQWVTISLAVILAIAIIGVIVMFVKYHKEIFSYVTTMNAIKADPTQGNPTLTNNAEKVK